jgi:hypothetical protein
VSSPAEAHLLPPPPAAVAAYFQRRRSSIAGFSPEDLTANERLWREICGLPELDPRPAAGMPTGATGSLAGELPGVFRHPSTPPIPTQIPECAEVIEVPPIPPISPPRAYHRRAKPRGSGRWAQKRRLAGAAA